jgi:hypothetical protein
MTSFSPTGTALGRLAVIVILGGVAAGAQQPSMGAGTRASHRRRRVQVAHPLHR